MLQDSAQATLAGVLCEGPTYPGMGLLVTNKSIETTAGTNRENPEILAHSLPYEPVG